MQDLSGFRLSWWSDVDRASGQVPGVVLLAHQWRVSKLSDINHEKRLPFFLVGHEGQIDLGRNLGICLFSDFIDVVGFQVLLGHPRWFPGIITLGDTDYHDSLVS